MNQYALAVKHTSRIIGGHDGVSETDVVACAGVCITVHEAIFHEYLSGKSSSWRNNNSSVMTFALLLWAAELSHGPFSFILLSHEIESTEMNLPRISF